jgi:single-strand DNA-binding protein
MNLVVITGRLGKDPDMRYTPGGKSVCKFSIAETKVISGEKKTRWWNIVAWGKLAEICTKYLGKGSHVLVEGELNQSTYTKDGVKITAFEVVAGKVEFLDPKGGRAEADTGSSADIPF